jgi:hypothetical protein
MAWAFKMFFKLIGKLFIFCFSLPFVVIALPFYLPYYFIKESKAKSGGVNLIERYYEKGMDKLDWIDNIELYDAAIE